MDKTNLKELKHQFSFINISDEEFIKIVNQNKDNNIVNNQELYDNLFKIIHEQVIKQDNIESLVNFLNIKQKYETKDEAVFMINQFSNILEKSNIVLDSLLYEKLVSKTKTLNTIIELIINNSDSYQDTIKGLSEYAIEFIDLYNEKKLSSITDNNELIDYSENDEINPKTTSSRYVQSINRIELLSKEEMEELITKYQKTKDKNIRKIIIEKNLRLVKSIATNIYKNNKQLPLDDLISVGSQGLFRALEDYDSTKSKFSTYATKCITQKIIREIQNQANSVRITVGIQEDIYKYNKKKNQLINKLGRVPTRKEISQILNIDLKDVELYEDNRNVLRLNTPLLEDTDTELIECIPSEYSDDDQVEKVLVKVLLTEELKPIENYTLQLRFGLYGSRKYTLQEVANKLYEKGFKNKTVSAEAVRIIEKKALQKLKEKLIDDKSRNIKKNKNNNIDKKEQVLQLITIIKHCDNNSLTYILYHLPTPYIKALENCCGNIHNITNERKIIENLSDEEINLLYNTVYPKITEIYKKMLIEKKNIKKTEQELPLNIYAFFDRFTKERIDKAIDNLTPKERIILNKYYDIYTGAYTYNSELTEANQEKIMKVINKIHNYLDSKKYIKQRDDKNGHK